MCGGKASAKSLTNSDLPDIELITEEESKEMIEIRGRAERKWCLLEVTLRGRNLIWCLGVYAWGRTFRIKSLNIDSNN
jgi:hypothetical protein